MRFHRVVQAALRRCGGIGLGGAPGARALSCLPGHGSAGGSSDGGSLRLGLLAAGAVAAAAAAGHAQACRAETDQSEQAKLARFNTARPKRKHYKYVILGAGTTAHAAIEAILSQDPGADLLLVSEEASLPHADCFLAPKTRDVATELLSSWNEWRRHITARLETEPDAISTSAITVLLHKRFARLDVERKQLLLDESGKDVVSFNRCLIATAGTPRPFYVLDTRKISYSLRDRINSLETLQDFEALQRLPERVKPGGSVVVVGGGFLGTEVSLAIASAMRESGGGSERGVCVTQMFAEKAPLAKSLPAYLSSEVARRLRGAGVACMGDRLVTDLKARYHFAEDGSEREHLELTAMGVEHEVVSADYAVLASTHCDPVVKVAAQSGLEIDARNGGIVVNPMLEAVNGVYAAGGCMSYFDESLGRRRVDRFDHAVNSGLLAGINMAAAESTGAQHPQLYTHQPAFHSNLSGIGLNMIGVGDVDARLRNVGAWVKASHGEGDLTDFSRGVVYYLDRDRVVGVLLVNCSFLLERAREMLRRDVRVTEDDEYDGLKRQMPLAPDDWVVVKWAAEDRAGPASVAPQ